ncbi:MAG: sigma-70 family RNA polymerase sigma factor [Bacteroidetes bacterium]|nr:sigma-70 family RNA polymerase sigma factor [Bacteroidota bacterium]
MSAKDISIEDAKISDWVHQYGDQLYRWAVQQLRDEASAQDLVQETFISAFQNFGKFKGESSAKTWLFSILKNKLTDHYRKISRLKLESLDTHDDTLFDPFDDGGNWKNNFIPKDWINAEEHLLDNPDFENVFVHCQEALPDLWSSCVKLKYLSKNESEEICQQLNISASNLWQILHRAKLQLRNCLEKNWFSK